MTDLAQDTTPGTWVAIDIAKKIHVVLVEFRDGKRRNYRLRRQLEEVDRFVAFLHAQDQPVRIGFEPTSNYHRTLAYRLGREGFELRLVSSVASARYREAMFNSWDKNDPKDAAVILALLKQGLTQFYHDPLEAGIHDRRPRGGVCHVASLGWSFRRPIRPGSGIDRSLAGPRIQHPGKQPLCNATFRRHISSRPHNDTFVTGAAA